MEKEKIPTKEQLEAYVKELKDYMISLNNYIAAYVGTTPPGPRPSNPPGMPKR